MANAHHSFLRKADVSDDAYWDGHAAGIDYAETNPGYDVDAAREVANEGGDPNYAMGFMASYRQSHNDNMGALDELGTPESRKQQGIARRQAKDPMTTPEHEAKQLDPREGGPGRSRLLFPNDPKIGDRVEVHAWGYDGAGVVDSISKRLDVGGGTKLYPMFHVTFDDETQGWYNPDTLHKT